MIRKLLLVALLASLSCAESDPCSGASEQCLTLRVEGPVEAMDEFVLQVTPPGASQAGALPAGVQRPPFLVPVIFSRPQSGEVRLRGTARLSGAAVARGEVSAPLPGSAAVTLTLTPLGAPAADMAAPSGPQFTAPVSAAVGAGEAASALLVGALTGASNVDVVVGNSDGLRFLQFAGGKLGPSPQADLTGAAKRPIALAQWSARGLLFLASANELDDKLVVYQKMGFNGSFSGAARSYTVTSFTPVQKRGLIAADLNGDGEVDAATLLPSQIRKGVVLFGSNDKLTGPSDYDLRSIVTTPAALALYNHPQGPRLAIAGSSLGLVRLDTLGTLTAETAPTYSGRGVVALAAGNLDGLSGPDLVLLSADGKEVSVLRSSSSTLVRFGPADSYALDCVPRDLALGDLDGDGKADVVVSCPSGLVLMRNDGTGKLPEQRTLVAGAQPGLLALADLNRDGKLDILVSDRGALSLTVLLQAP